VAIRYSLLILQSSDGGRTRARTLDPLIKSQLLYQLSYAPIGNNQSAGFAALDGGDVAKQIVHVQHMTIDFSGFLQTPPPMLSPQDIVVLSLNSLPEALCRLPDLASVKPCVARKIRLSSQE
jgi:hypothetical protein